MSNWQPAGRMRPPEGSVCGPRRYEVMINQVYIRNGTPLSSIFELDIATRKFITRNFQVSMLPAKQMSLTQVCFKL